MRTGPLAGANAAARSPIPDPRCPPHAPGLPFSLVRPSRLAPTLAALAAAGGLVAAAPPARADEGKSFEITVDPRGQSWAIGPHGGQECTPTCILHLPADKYPMEIGGAKETLYLSGPVSVTYRPGSKVLRYAGLGVGLGGLVIGGIMIYVVARSCVTESTNPQTGHCDLLKLTPPQQRGLITFTAAVISASVAGGILFALSGESIRVEDAPEPPRRPVGFTWRPIVGGFATGAGSGLHGATLELQVRF